VAKCPSTWRNRALSVPGGLVGEADGSALTRGTLANVTFCQIVGSPRRPATTGGRRHPPKLTVRPS
jgi:hypothetical protein